MLQTGGRPLSKNLLIKCKNNTYLWSMSIKKTGKRQRPWLKISFCDDAGHIPLIGQYKGLYRFKAVVFRGQGKPGEIPRNPGRVGDPEGRCAGARHSDHFHGRDCLHKHSGKVYLEFVRGAETAAAVYRLSLVHPLQVSGAIRLYEMGICENGKYLIMLFQLDCKYDKYILFRLVNIYKNRALPPRWVEELTLAEKMKYI